MGLGVKMNRLWNAVDRLEETSGERPRYLVGHPSDEELGKAAEQYLGLAWIACSDVPVGHILPTATRPDEGM